MPSSTGSSGWQAVAVLLIGAQFGRGRFRDDLDARGSPLPLRRPSSSRRCLAVAPATDLENPRFIQVLDRIVAARHIPVDRRIAHRHFGFITCRQQHFTKFVGLSHQAAPRAERDWMFSSVSPGCDALQTAAPAHAGDRRTWTSAIEHSIRCAAQMLSATSVPHHPATLAECIV